MKKLFQIVICFLIFPAVGCPAASAAEESNVSPLYTTTVMIYMCGSDLESRLGAATNDIAEIMNSGFDKEHTNVIIMAGGSKWWNTGFQTEATSIVEMKAGGMRPVWRSESPMSMAEEKTLQTFLEYSYSHFPADRYGLIIWDHGGGPNIGVCYDELFNWNTLGIWSVSNAIHDSLRSEAYEEMWKATGRSVQGLDWIGFDACLMSTVETASALGGCAEVLVASQEQEPSSGWNYSFLNGLEKDPDTMTTGQRIVEAYFEKQEERHGEILTLSCIRLDRISAVCEGMQDYFSKLYPILTEDSYPLLSRERSAARSFGRAEYNEAEDCDLVDLISLIQANDTLKEEGERLIRQIREAVFCTDSNIDGANGLSVYHPYFNGETYTEKWEESYERVFGGMVPAYYQYVRRFGQILTGGELGDWSGLETERKMDQDGNLSFSVALTEDQAALFEHATLMVLKQVVADNQISSQLYNCWETVYLDLDDKRTVSARLPEKSVFVVDDNTGEVLCGPIDYRITRDGQLQVTVTYYDEQGMLDPDMLHSMYYCSFAKDENRLNIDTICAYSPETRDYSRRMSIDEKLIRERGFAYANFFIFSGIPTWRGDELLAYRDWEQNAGVVWSQIDLPCSWHFEVRENKDMLEMMKVSFQITDTQNRTHSSTLRPVHPELIEEYESEWTRSNESADFPVEIKGISSRHYLNMGWVSAELKLERDRERVRTISARDLVLNGDRVMEGMGFMEEQDGNLILTLPGDKMSGLSALFSISFDLVIRGENTWDDVTDHVEIRFPEPIILEREVVSENSAE